VGWGVESIILSQQGNVSGYDQFIAKVKGGGSPSPSPTPSPTPAPTPAPTAQPPAPSDVTVLGGKVTVTVSKTSSWATGYCNNVTLKNADTKSVTWTLRMPKKGTIYNSWNVVPKVEGSEFVFNGAAWNSTLTVGQSADFGYCVNL
jgi:cellulase/cellobiase CelA1